METRESGFTLIEAMVSIFITGLMIVILLRGDQAFYYEKAEREFELIRRMRTVCAEELQRYTAETELLGKINERKFDEQGYRITIQISEERVRNGRLIIIKVEGVIKGRGEHQKEIKQEFEERYLL